MGVSTLWLNSFFQTPLQSHFQSEGEETSAVCYYALQKRVSRDGLSRGLVCVCSNTLSKPKLLNRKSEGSRLSPGTTGNQRSRRKRVAVLKHRLHGMRATGK